MTAPTPDAALTEDEVYALATAIYGDGESAAWLRPVDDSANSASWDYAQRAAPAVERILAARMASLTERVAEVEARNEALAAANERLHTLALAEHATPSDPPQDEAPFVSGYCEDGACERCVQGPEFNLDGRMLVDECTHGCHGDAPAPASADTGLSEDQREAQIRRELVRRAGLTADEALALEAAKWVTQIERECADRLAAVERERDRAVEAIKVVHPHSAVLYMQMSEKVRAAEAERDDLRAVAAKVEAVRTRWAVRQGWHPASELARDLGAALATAALAGTGAQDEAHIDGCQRFPTGWLCMPECRVPAEHEQGEEGGR